MRKTAFIAIFALLVSPLFAAFSPETSDSLFYHDHAYEIDLMLTRLIRNTCSIHWKRLKATVKEPRYSGDSQEQF